MEDYKLAMVKLCELQVQILHHWLTVEQVGTVGDHELLANV